MVRTYLHLLGELHFLHLLLAVAVEGGHGVAARRPRQQLEREHRPRAHRRRPQRRRACTLQSVKVIEVILRSTTSSFGKVVTSLLPRTVSAATSSAVKTLPATCSSAPAIGTRKRKALKLLHVRAG